MNAKIEKENEKYKVVICERTKPLSTLDLVNSNYSNDNAKKELLKIFKDSSFDYPKPTELIKTILSIYGNKSVFSISVSEQADGTQLLVTMVRPHKYLSADGIQRAVTAVADRISQYLENETVLANASLRRSKLQESVCKA